MTSWLNSYLVITLSAFPLSCAEDQKHLELGCVIHAEHLGALQVQSTSQTFN